MDFDKIVLLADNLPLDPEPGHIPHIHPVPHVQLPVLHDEGLSELVLAVVQATEQTIKGGLVLFQYLYRLSIFEAKPIDPLLKVPMLFGAQILLGQCVRSGNLALPVRGDGWGGDFLGQHIRHQLYGVAIIDTVVRNMLVAFQQYCLMEETLCLDGYAYFLHQ